MNKKDRELLDVALDTEREECKYFRERYEELLYAVQTKHPGETRHETALRYIRERETPTNNAAECSLADAAQQALASLDAIIVQVGSDVLPKGWLASANRLRQLLSGD